MANQPSTEPNVSTDDSVDSEIAKCLNLKKPQNFFLFAGAGSGKTRSLVNALGHLRNNHGSDLELYDRKIGVITYTNAACDEINRRIDFHPLFQVSTIHSFAWNLIKGFNSDIRKWLEKKLTDDIESLKIAELKGREGTKASIARVEQIKSKEKKLERLNTIKLFTYSPNGENRQVHSLNHAEVISICSEFLSEKKLMGTILIGRFPFLLIDESQDTNKHFMEALFSVAEKHPSHFCIGLIGDVMQRIYADGKDRLESEIPADWAKPAKKLNHRCPKRIVRLINKVRDEVDDHTQAPKSDAPEGNVRMFIVPSNSTKIRGEIENDIRDMMANKTGDVKWKKQSDCKILTLEHHMAAERLRFEKIFQPLYAIDSWRTGLLDGRLPELNLFTKSILPLIEAQCDNDKFLVAQIMRKSSPMLTQQALKDASNPTDRLKSVKQGVEALVEVYKKPQASCGEILLCVHEHDLFQIPDSLAPIVQILKNIDFSKKAESKDDRINEKIDALLSVMEAPFEQIKPYYEYVLGEASFDTHQGVKGLEFERVMVIMNDFEARGVLFSYGKFLGDKELSKKDQENLKEGKDNSIERTRRLFYVTCSRAKSSLALIMYSDDCEKTRDHVLEKGWFDENEIDLSNW